MKRVSLVNTARIADAADITTLVPGADPVQPSQCGPCTPRVDAKTLVVLDFLAAVPCVVRDDRFIVRWCNEAYVSLSKVPKSDLLGTRMEDFLPRKAAAERNETLREVLETGQMRRYYQFGADKRLLCSLLPIDPESFGYRGVLVMVQQDTGMGCEGSQCESIPVLGTPSLDELGVLSPAELRVLLHLGKGRTTAEIGEHLSRSAKTIEKQIESVHRKLGTRSRAELVKLAVERGLQAFSDADWERIIEGSKAVKRP